MGKGGKQKSKPRVLLIEDCPEVQQQIGEALRPCGYEVSTICDVDEALASVEQWAGQYHLVIIEEAMRGRAGLRLLREARSQQKNLPVVVVTRDGNWSGYAQALSAGAQTYLTHPIDHQEFVTAVRDALSRAS
jgi:two-component system, OmpR family, response regulator PhoP